MNLTAKKITDALKRLGYPLFKGDYNLNLIGVRSKDINSNKFNDQLIILFSVDGNQHIYKFPMTTDPGVYYRENPVNVDGTAVLAPGHYSSCWQTGVHRGQYYALIQVGDMTVYRDPNGDTEIDVDGVRQAGLFGINLHRANKKYMSDRVDKWSAGCQVVADPVDFELLMALVKKSAQIYGERFSYTLLLEDELSCL